MPTLRSMVHLGSAVAVMATVACANASIASDDSSSVRNAPVAAEPVNAANALSLSDVLTADYVAAHGSCVRTAAAPARSRLVYVLIPDQSTYVRLNVVSSADGSRPEMIDLARGVGGARIWYATVDRGASVVRTELFLNQGDKQPTVAEEALSGPAGQRLEQLARSALSLPCGGQS